MQIMCHFDTAFMCGYSDFSRNLLSWLRFGKNEGKLNALTGLNLGMFLIILLGSLATTTVFVLTPFD